MSLLIKVTPVLAVVGVVDITRAAVRIGAETYEPLPPFFVALAIYVPIVFALVSMQRWLERAARSRRLSRPHDPRLRASSGRERGLMLSGLANTVVLSVLGRLCALVLGALLSTRADARGARRRRVGARVFVDAMRCTPFLLFAYIVYYGLPSIGHPLRQLGRRAVRR